MEGKGLEQGLTWLFLVTASLQKSRPNCGVENGLHSMRFSLLLLRMLSGNLAGNCRGKNLPCSWIWQASKNSGGVMGAWYGVQFTAVGSSFRRVGKQGFGGWELLTWCLWVYQALKQETF